MQSSTAVVRHVSTTFNSKKTSSWPVRIFTLGRFAVMVNDEPLFFGGRVQTRPFELLRSVIALGGRGVAIESLAQDLWPDATAKIAKHSLETTLYRLRKLLGDRCIDMKGGYLTVDSDWCWVDIWNIDLVLDSAREATSQMQRLFELYQGPFLEGDDTPSVLIQRERLHSKFLRAVSQLGRTLQLQGCYEHAIECYQRGIEADPLAEELYCCLMQCFHELKRSAEALATYWRCHKTLTCILGVEPAPETEVLFQKIQLDNAKRQTTARLAE